MEQAAESTTHNDRLEIKCCAICELPTHECVQHTLPKYLRSEPVIRSRVDVLMEKAERLEKYGGDSKTVAEVRLQAERLRRHARA